MTFGVNFTKEIPNEISWKSQNVVQKNEEGGGSILQKNPYSKKRKGINLTKEIPFNEISERLKNVSKKLGGGGGGQFYTKILFKRNLQILLKKSERGWIIEKKSL